MRDYRKIVRKLSVSILYWQRSDNHSQKKPRAELLVDYACVLTDPTDACLSSQGALDKRASRSNLPPTPSATAAGMQFQKVRS